MVNFYIRHLVHTLHVTGHPIGVELILESHFVLKLCRGFLLGFNIRRVVGYFPDSSNVLFDLLIFWWRVVIEHELGLTVRWIVAGSGERAVTARHSPAEHSLLARWNQPVGRFFGEEADAPAA